jgi:intergrase/recombinase
MAARPGDLNTLYNATNTTRELSKAVGLPAVELHAARHSAISTMAELGIAKDLCKMAVGHAAYTVHDRHTHYQDAAPREAASQAEAHVTSGGERA